MLLFFFKIKDIFRYIVYSSSCEKKKYVEMGVLITYQTMINIINYEKMEGLFRVTAHVYTAYLVLTVMRHLEFYYTYCDYV